MMATWARGAACLLLTALASATSYSVASDDTVRALGERLFQDERLSADGTIACASCHVPAKAFADGLPRSVGSGGAIGTRNAPSLLSLADHKVLLWDGRRRRLEDQVLDPLGNPGEHGFESVDQAIRQVSRIPEYARSFAQAYPGEGVSRSTVAAALSAFLRSLGAGPSRFERHAAGDSSALSGAEKRGLALFTGRGQCASCHLAEGRHPTFTDDEFHAVSSACADRGTSVAAASRKLAQQPAIRLDVLLASDAAVAGLGRFAVTGRPSDIGKFRTPSLRNVAVTAPYMHDGSVPTLEDAVDLELYYRGAHQGRPIVFTADEKSDLVAFLKSLTAEGLEEVQGPK